jgi:hypothetical protein
LVIWVQISSPTEWVQSENVVGATTVPVNTPDWAPWTAILPPLKDQIPSIGGAAAAAPDAVAQSNETASNIDDKKQRVCLFDDLGMAP